MVDGAIAQVDKNLRSNGSFFILQLRHIRIKINDWLVL